MSTILGKYTIRNTGDFFIKGYDLVSSVASSVRDNPITTFGLLGINLGASYVGGTISRLTGRRIELNNAIPRSVRNFFHKIGRGIGKKIRKLVV